MNKCIKRTYALLVAHKTRGNKSNIRHTWSTIKEILNKCKDKKDFPAFFTLNGENIEDKTEISNTFNNCFASIGTKLSNSIDCNGTKTISSFLKQRVISSFDVECISTTDVEKIVKNLASKNSSGPVFCLLLGVSSGCARPITGQVTSVTWPVIGWA